MFAQTLVSTTTLEYLAGHYQHLLPRLRPLMGPATLEMLHVIETWEPDMEVHRKALDEWEAQVKADPEFRQRVESSTLHQDYYEWLKRFRR